MELINRVLPARGPRRVLAAGTFVNSFGGGMFVASCALYFTRVVGLSAEQVASGLVLGAAVGLLAGVFAGKVADRYGAKETQLAVMLCGAAAMSANLLVRAFWPYVLVCVFIGLVYAADKASKAPLIRGFGGDDAVAFRAYLRSVVNLAWSIGAMTAGVGIQIDSPAAYRCLIIGRAAAFLGSALVQLRLPRLEPIPAPAGGARWAALRDRPYLSATLLNCLMSLHMAVPTFLLPLWIVGHTEAPRWLVAGMLVINTMLIVGLQVPISQGVDDQRAAGQRMRWAGAALLAGLGLMGAASGLDAWSAGALLVGGMVVYTLGELWHSAAAMEWSFGLAPAHAQGQYAGVFGLGIGAAEAMAPAVLSVLCLGWGRPGWFVLGAGFLAVGAVSPALVAWAERTGRVRTAPAVAM